MNERIRKEILYLSGEVRKCQDADGAWRLRADNGIMTDAYFIILCRVLGLSLHEDLITRLTGHLLELQNAQGTWSVYPDEPDGNFSATIEAVYALLCSGAISTDDKRITRAKSELGANSGTRKLGKSTHAFFAGIGQLPWPKYQFPTRMLFASRWSPVHFNRFVGYARAHIAPVLLASLLNSDIPASTTASHLAFAREHWPKLPDLVPGLLGPQVDVFSIKNVSGKLGKQLVREVRYIGNPVWAKWFIGNPAKKEAILNRLEAYILNNIEQDGTLYSYATSTYFMILALISRGYSSDHPILTKAIDGIAALAHHDQSFSHIQNADATVWNTGLMSYALQGANITDNADMISRAVQYLLSRQHSFVQETATPEPSLLSFASNPMETPKAPAMNPGTVSAAAHGVIPAGWGFSDRNTLVPDVDDTCAALRALCSSTALNSITPEAKAFASGIHWVWSMQNKDGGWPAFEKDVNNPLFTRIEVDGAKGVLTDPSSADLTGRTLEFFGNYCNLTVQHPNIKKAVRWMLKNQNPDGSWQGRWGVCYVYGTWAAMTGLRAIGLPNSHPALQKAAGWLLSIQQADGGFGESCRSDVQKKYVPLQHSTISQTAWGLDALIALFDEPNIPIFRAADFLLEHIQNLKEKWATYPTGAGLPGSFYIQYQSYNYIWPLLALGHYKQKYGT